MLKVSALDVHYGAVQALHGVNLEVRQGEIVTLIGANGAGKSTVLRAVSGLVAPSKGSITFEGSAIAGVKPHVLVKRGIAHAPEGRGIFASLTVDENLSLGAYTRNDSAIADDRDKALTLFPRLRERLGQAAGTMSGGEQQMLAIARALLARPKLLLLDEPSLGLAPLVVQTIFDVIRTINASGTTIVLVEQNAHMALEVAHRAYVLEVGRVVMADEAAVVAKSPIVQKAYLGLA